MSEDESILPQHWLLAAEITAIALEDLTHGKGSPHADNHLYNYPPDELLALAESLSREHLPRDIKERLEAITATLQIRNRKALEAGQLRRFFAQSDLWTGETDYEALGQIEAQRYAPSDRLKRYWFLSGWNTPI